MQYVTRTCWRCEQEKPEGAFHQKAVERALERGELVRPAGCMECGVVGATDAHHDDYSKPLEVRWLCRSCHSRHHNVRSNPSRRKVDVRLPAVLLESVDRAAEELGQTRTKFLERALEQALGGAYRPTGDGGESESAGTPAARHVQVDNAPAPARKPVADVEPTPLPKIARRHWVS